MKKRRKQTQRKLKRSIIVFLSALLALFIIGFIGLKITENGTYTVYDIKTQEQYGTYNHFIFAKWKMHSLEENENIVISNQNGKIVALHNAIVNFNTKEVTENTSYVVDGTNEDGYLNGSYGTDGLYIETSNDGSKVLFMMSGVKAWVSIEDIQLFYYDNYLQSYYYVNNGSLIHAILIDADSAQYQTLAIGEAPDFLKENTTYFSYDGNWFYTDMDQLSSDVLNDVHDNAINSEAYFNFYQYVPHRSLTNLDDSDYNEYLSSVGISATANAYPCADTESVLYENGSIFTKVQDQTYINATMMFAVALNESGYGQSQYAIENHNLFGHAAYDSNPDNANSYDSLEDCVYQHAYNFLQQGYANPEDERYHGSWFGNKASGINVQYASDPYWGEKAASFYYSLDNGKDLNEIQIITQKLKNDLNVYDKIDGSVLYSYEKGDIISFVYTDSDNGWYQIMSEAPVKDGKIDINSTYTKDSVGYIQASDLNQ